MKLGIVIYSNDAETVWNAFRLANFSLKEGDAVKVFLIAKGVEYEKLDSEKFGIKELAKSFLDGNLWFRHNSVLNPFQPIIKPVISIGPYIVVDSKNSTNFCCGVNPIV